MIHSLDQTGRKVSLKNFPRKIISVVPSQTEFLFDLGLEDEVIAITKFCIHPAEWFRSKTRIGGTKKLNIDFIRSLSPDLIIANIEENTKEDIEILINDFPVWISDIKNLDDAIEMMQEIGQLTNRSERAFQLTDKISDRFNKLILEAPPVSCLYVIWKNPFMVAGGDTYITDMLHRNGLSNLVKDKTRYPELTQDDLIELSPQLLLLSSEPFPFKEKDVAELQVLLPDTNIILVDGEMFSWYGSRLLKAPDYFRVLQKEIHSSTKL